jgi:two-component system response regulator
MGTDAFTGRATDMAPQVILLYLKLPKLDGLGSLQLVCSDERAKLLSAAIFTSSIKAQDQTDGYGVGANNYVSEPMDFNQFVDAERLAPYWLQLNEPPPARRT